MKPTNSSSTRKLKPVTEAQIAALAHELWLAQGCPAGKEVSNWLEAERMLQGNFTPSHRDPIPADPARPDVDDDPALAGPVDRELRGVGAPATARSPTSL